MNYFDIAERILHKYQYRGITNVCFDSRNVFEPKKSLFFAIPGINHNGHDYVLHLYEKGCRAFVVSEKRSEFLRLEDSEFYYVDDVIDAMQQLASVYRKMQKSKIVGITGSNGKTIVKEWLYYMFDGIHKVYRSPGSYNSQVGVPISLLGIPEMTQISFLEAGISKFGEMSKLEQMLSPDVGIFTNIGHAHSDGFASIEEKINEKAKLFINTPKIICRRGKVSEYLVKLFGRERLVVWGNEYCDIIVNEGRIIDNRRFVEINYLYNNFEIEIPFADLASFENVIHVVSYMLLSGINIDYIKNKISSLQPVAMRMEVKEGINNCELINDYYNSDPESFGLAMSSIKMNSTIKKKCVILSDFVSINMEDDILFENISNQMTDSGVDLFIGIGEKLYSKSYCFNDIPNKHFYRTTEEFLRLENKQTFSNMVILIKGARNFLFEKISAFLQQKTHNTRLEVDLNSIAHNLDYFRHLVAKGTKMAVMVKAFSYGIGLVDIARFLEYKGVDYLMVAYADEGVALRNSGIKIPIAVMNPSVESLSQIIDFRLEPEISNFDLLYSFKREVNKYGIEKYPVHIKINTGMNRSGFDEIEIVSLIQELQKDNSLYVKSVFSHLACSDDSYQDAYTEMQFDLFDNICYKIKIGLKYEFICHILNSSGIERFPERAYDMVRLGIGLHGISANGAKLSVVSRFMTKIASIRHIKKGSTVGYGRRGLLERDGSIAVIQVGYADGLRRILGNGVGEVYVNGKRVQIIGNICMDLSMIDITGLDVKIGDDVEIFGTHIPIKELADKTHTIPYEILTSISSRVKRVYYRE